MTDDSRPTATSDQIRRQREVANERRVYLPVFSIGHSHHSREHFIELLRRHGIDIVLDVRSAPYSRRAPQFNRNELEAWLAEAGVRYSFGGRALGGRPNDPALYIKGQVDYDLIATTETFRQGLRRVARAAKSARVALMCAEAEPLECHRFLLISRALSGALDLYHILSSGRAESQREVEQRLLVNAGLAQSALFEENANVLQRAYTLLATRFAYSTSLATPTRDSDLEPDS